MANQDIMDDLKLKFDGDTNQIDVNTLINNLIHFTAIVQEVNRELHTERKIEIKINALAPGSFLVHILLQSNLIEQIGNFFTKENLEVAASIVTVVAGVYGAAKFLKGKDGEIVESNQTNTTVKNNEGDVTIIDNRVFNIYKGNTVIRNAISQEFTTLDNDVNITSFEILNKEDKPLVEIPKEDFSSIASLNETTIHPNEKVIPKKGVLSIASLSFENNAKWNFYYEGNKFSAKISDDEFVRLIDSGERFAKGDSLEAEFEIKQQFDESANTYINKSYKIIKIIRHIPRPEQGRLDFRKTT